MIWYADSASTPCYEVSTRHQTWYGKPCLGRDVILGDGRGAVASAIRMPDAAGMLARQVVVMVLLVLHNNGRRSAVKHDVRATYLSLLDETVGVDVLRGGYVSFVDAYKKRRTFERDMVAVVG